MAASQTVGFGAKRRVRFGLEGNETREKGDGEMRE